MKTALFAFLWLVTISLNAQSNYGIIGGHLSSEGKAVSGANVVIQKTKLATVTDSTGFFEIKNIAAGKYTLQATYVGSQKIELQVMVGAGKETKVDASFRHISANLNDVVVTGDLQPLDKSKSIASIDVLTVKDFERTPVTNVFDALTYAKGIFCDIDQGLTNPIDVNINGLEGNYTMFTIDGVPAMNNIAGIFALSAFPVSMVDNIQIEKGSNSTVYGSDAVGGVVNISTKDPATAPRLSLNATLYSKLESELGLTATFHLKKVNTLFSVSSDNMNYRWDIDHDGFMDLPLVNRNSIFNKWSFIRKENRVAIIYTRYMFEGRFTGQMNTPGRLKGSDNYFSQWLGTNQWQAGFQYQLPCKERFFLLADYSEHYQQAKFDTINYHGVLRNVFTQFNWNKKLGKHQFMAGITYRLRYYRDNSSLSDMAITGIGSYAHTAGAFIQDELRLNDQNALFFGVRFDYSNLSGPVAAPCFNYKWNSIDQRNVIRVAAGTGYRVPNLLNEGFTALETSRQVIVPQRLKTEYSVSLNLDYKRTQLFDAGVLNFEAGLFGIYLVNFVEPDYFSDSATVIYNNSQGGGAFGLSTGLDWQFKFPLHLGFNGTYSYTFELDRDTAEDEVELETPTHSPYFMANFYASYTFAKPQITIDLNGNLVSPMLLATVPNDFRPGKSPWFSLLNVQITKKFRKGVELFAGVKNLLNFVPKNSILRPYDPFNRTVAYNNPNNYRFDTTYAYSTIEGIKGFIGIRFILQ